MIAEVFALLGETTLALSAAAALVLALRAPVRGAFGARPAYALWLLVPAAGIAVLLPARQVVLHAPGGSSTQGAVSLATGTTGGAPLDPAAFVLLAWLAGAVLLAARLAWQQRRFVRALGVLRVRDDGHLQAESAQAGPAVVGVWRPRVVVPGDFEARYDARERELVLRHEHAHLARRDPLANLAAAVLRCVQWFNPMLHLAAERFRVDQELAADATVLAQYPQARRVYAQALLKAQECAVPSPLGCRWQSHHPLKERIAMLTRPAPAAPRLAAGFALAFALAAITAFAAWAGQPAQIRVVAEADGPAAAALDAPITFKGSGVHLRDAAARLLAGAGLVLANPQALPESGEPVEFDFDDIRLATAIEMLVEAHGLVAVADSGNRVRLVPRAALEQSRPSAENAPHDAAPLASPSARLAGAPTEDTDVPSYREMTPPRYPKSAIEAGHTGKVVLELVVGPDGAPREIEVMETSGHAALDAAAATTAREWKFDPARRNGQAMETRISVPVDFALDAPAGEVAPAPEPRRSAG